MPILVYTDKYHAPGVAPGPLPVRPCTGNGPTLSLMHCVESSGNSTAIQLYNYTQHNQLKILVASVWRKKTNHKRYYLVVVNAISGKCENKLESGD